MYDRTVYKPVRLYPYMCFTSRLRIAMQVFVCTTILLPDTHLLPATLRPARGGYVSHCRVTRYCVLGTAPDWSK